MENFAQIIYNNGKIWNAHYRSVEDAISYATNYAKHWDLTFTYKIKNV